MKKRFFTFIKYLFVSFAVVIASLLFYLRYVRVDTRQNISETETYKNEEHGFSLALPSSWELRKEPGNIADSDPNYVAIYYIAPKAKQDGHYSSIVILKGGIDEAIEKLKKTKNEYNAFLVANNGSELVETLDSTTNLSFAEKDATVVTYKSVDVVNEYIFLSHKGNVYMFFRNVNEINEGFENANKIVTSIKFF